MLRYTLPIALILLTGCPTPEEQAADVFTEVEIGMQMSPLQADLPADSRSSDSGSTTAGPPCLTSHHRHTLSAVR